MIEFKNVFIKYIQSFYSLYNFSHTFNKNTLIIGDATIGSSAILRIISKIDTDFTGNVYIDNLDIKSIKDKDINLAFVPQKCELFLHKNVEKNLLYPFIIRKTNKEIAKIKIFEFLKQFNLQQLLKTKVKKLNPSEQKIIALMRAIIREPQYILIEDFFKSLDINYHSLANKLINFAAKKSIIIACEEEINVNYYKNFEILELKKGD